MKTFTLPLEQISSFSTELPLSEELIQKYQNVLPESLKGAAVGRKIEFTAGRYCAFQAAKLIQIELNELKVGKNREPLWPENLVGSISHTKGYAIAAVALKQDIRSIGIDIERIISQKRLETIDKMVLTESDKQLLNQTNEQKLLSYTAIFSAKESLYKAVFPFCQCYFGFKDAKVNHLDLQNQTIELEIISMREEMQPYLGKYQVNFYVHKDYIISAIILK